MFCIKQAKEENENLAATHQSNQKRNINKLKLLKVVQKRIAMNQS